MCWCRCRCYTYNIFICFPLLLLFTFFTLCHPYFFALCCCYCFCHWCCYFCSWSPSCCQFFFRIIFLSSFFYVFNSSFDALFVFAFFCFRMDFVYMLFEMLCACVGLCVRHLHGRINALQCQASIAHKNTCDNDIQHQATKNKEYKNTKNKFCKRKIKIIKQYVLWIFGVSLMIHGTHKHTHKKSETKICRLYHSHSCHHFQWFHWFLFGVCT